MIFNKRIVSEYRATFCHWRTSLVERNYSSVIIRMSFICYANSDGHRYSLKLGVATASHTDTSDRYCYQ